MTEGKSNLHIMAIDCCEDILAVLQSVRPDRLTSLSSKTKDRIEHFHDEPDLIVIGVSKYPIRRLFLSQLRRIYSKVPLLILRREEVSGEETNRVRGEFILSDQGHEEDLKIVNQLRALLPLKPCPHTHKSYNYNVVREVLRVIAENYSDPDLDLARVAKVMPMSPVRLSRILNQQVGISFRQLLRHLRIEEAKLMLTARELSVKEVAARVGFSDSHYFSRSFKELTGLSASDYRAQGRNVFQ
jgi:AraC-like DNA-binding protein